MLIHVPKTGDIAHLTYPLALITEEFQVLLVARRTHASEMVAAIWQVEKYVETIRALAEEGKGLSEEMHCATVALRIAREHGRPAVDWNDAHALMRPVTVAMGFLAADVAPRALTDEECGTLLEAMRVIQALSSIAQAEFSASNQPVCM